MRPDEDSRYQKKEFVAFGGLIRGLMRPDEGKCHQNERTDKAHSPGSTVS